jgi:hypothetical protein
MQFLSVAPGSGRLVPGDTCPHYFIRSVIHQLNGAVLQTDPLCVDFYASNVMSFESFYRTPCWRENRHANASRMIAMVSSQIKWLQTNHNISPVAIFPQDILVVNGSHFVLIEWVHCFPYNNISRDITITSPLLFAERKWVAPEVLSLNFIPVNVVSSGWKYSLAKMCQSLNIRGVSHICHILKRWESDTPEIRELDCLLLSTESAMEAS